MKTMPLIGATMLLFAAASSAFAQDRGGSRGGRPPPTIPVTAGRPGAQGPVFRGPSGGGGPGTGGGAAPVFVPRTGGTFTRTAPWCRIYPAGLLPVGGGALPGGGPYGPSAGVYRSGLRFEFEQPTDRGGDMADLYLDEDQTMHLLADPLFTEDNRRELEDEIVGGEMASLPMLLAHFSDPRPLPSGGVIGDEVQYLFFRIVTGDYQSDKAPKGAHASRSIFTIKDLEGWWMKNRSRPIEDIQDEMAHVVDRYWSKGQKTQEL